MNFTLCTSLISNPKLEAASMSHTIISTSAIMVSLPAISVSHAHIPAIKVRPFLAVWSYVSSRMQHWPQPLSKEASNPASLTQLEHVRGIRETLSPVVHHNDDTQPTKPWNPACYSGERAKEEHSYSWSLLNQLVYLLIYLFIFLH